MMCNVLSMIEMVVFSLGRDIGHTHALARMQMSAYGQMIVADYLGTEIEMERFVDSLKVFTMSFGAGFINSLIGPVKLFYERGLQEAARGASASSATSLRFSIGLEDTDILITDIEQAAQLV